MRLLEVGTGSGAMARFFSACEPRVVEVFSVDVRDQRTAREGYSFQCYDGKRLPFEDGSFDVVISNHVIEHVGGREAQAAHLAELSRVLAADGVGYLACPSRWMPVEPHFRLFGLSWLPRAWRSAYVRSAGRGTHYDCDPYSHREMESAMQLAGMSFSNRNVEALKALARCERSPGLGLKLLSLVPERWLRRFYRLSPTMIYVWRPTLPLGVDRG